MRNRNLVAYLIFLGLLLMTLSGCQEPEVAEPDNSQILQPTISDIDATDAADGMDASESIDNTEAPSIDSKWFADLWRNYVRYDYDGYSQLVVRELAFLESGQGFLVTQEWFRWDVATGEIFYPEGSTAVTDDFTYTLEANQLSVTYTKNDMEDYEDFTHVYEITPSAYGMSFVWSNISAADGEKNTVFVHNSDRSIFDLDVAFQVFGLGNSPFHPEKPQEPVVPDDTQPPTEYVSDSEKPSDTGWFLGDWTFVSREDRKESDDTFSIVTSVTYSFGANGSGFINERGWIGRPGKAWEVAGMGFVESYFSYTLEGNTLTIIHTGNEFEEYPENSRQPLVYYVAHGNDGSISWMPEGGGEDRVYRRVTADLTVDELLSIFGLTDENLQN